MMKACIELSLRTKEVYQLFERKIHGNRLFIEAILHKFNLVAHLSQDEEPDSMVIFKQMEQAILLITQQFTDEVDRFESVLMKRNNLNCKKIDFMARFNTKIPTTNSLSMQLANFIEIYDRLIATLKLLHIAGCFETIEDYYENIKRLQKLANRMLSNIMMKRIDSYKI